MWSRKGIKVVKNDFQKPKSSHIYQIYLIYTDIKQRKTKLQRMFGIFLCSKMVAD